MLWHLAICFVRFVIFLVLILCDIYPIRNGNSIAPDRILEADYRHFRAIGAITCSRCPYLKYFRIIVVVSFIIDLMNCCLGFCSYELTTFTISSALAFPSFFFSLYSRF